MLSFSSRLTKKDGDSDNDDDDDDDDDLSKNHISVSTPRVVPVCFTPPWIVKCKLLHLILRKKKHLFFLSL